MDISIVIPAYNEEDNVVLLYKEIKDSVSKITRDYEIIFIDDGSIDKTFPHLLILKKKDDKVRIIKFRKNFGQTAAMDAGFKAAKGKIIIAMDSDLQNDPRDIPKLLKKMDEGYDVVSGWRYDRKDSISKKA
ncbi:MAG: glycosyltransferase family 2 protein, partial [Nanoarchaeota archaeon]|nr:glycosyltransferase family 2 protein [Nanoarchaeota archaeon]